MTFTHIEVPVGTFGFDADGDHLAQSQAGSRSTRLERLPKMAGMERVDYTVDTSRDALEVQLACLRQMSPHRRIRQTLAMSRRVRKMAMDAIRRRHPDFGDVDVGLMFIELTYGKSLADGIARWRGASRMTDSDDLIDALAPVVEAFQRLQIRHYVGGSIASSFHGATRSTMDVDLVVELSEEKISDFVNCFGDEYYLSEAAVRDAVRRRGCFNLIHLPSSFKVDIFVSRGRPFDDESMRRARLVRLGDTKSVEVPIATAEDTIISKLEWFRLTNETSERQWDDVTRLLKLLGDVADVTYLQRAAEAVGVDDLWERLWRQSTG